MVQYLIVVQEEQPWLLNGILLLLEEKAETWPGNHY